MLLTMPKEPIKLKIVAYDQNFNNFAECCFYAYLCSEAFELFDKHVDFLTSGQPYYISRIDYDCDGCMFISLVVLHHILD